MVWSSGTLIFRPFLNIKNEWIQDDFANSMPIFPNHLSEWKIRFMGSYLDYASALGMRYDGITKKFENINIFMEFMIQFPNESPWILLKLSDFETKSEIQHTMSKIFKFSNFSKFFVISHENNATKMELSKNHSETKISIFHLFFVCLKFASKFDISSKIHGCPPRKSIMEYGKILIFLNFFVIPSWSIPRALGQSR